VIFLCRQRRLSFDRVVSENSAGGDGLAGRKSSGDADEDDLTSANSDRLLWIGLRAVWSRWEKALVIIRLQTVIGWHRAGFRLDGAGNRGAAEDCPSIMSSSV
jgi:hypothetical protein